MLEISDSLNLGLVLITIGIILYLFFFEKFNNIDKNVNDCIFIILRHVNSHLTNNYWKESYKCIRKFYPDIKIVIIDDNSNKKYLNDDDIILTNVEIINSEFPARGELLPYYYLYKKQLAKKAIIIHDSIFIQKKIKFEDVKDVKFLWHHGHYFDNIKDEKKQLLSLNNSDSLRKLYDNKNGWLLSCGVMSVIEYDFLKQMELKYNFFNLLNVVKTRHDRMCLERIFGLVCHALKPELFKNPSIYGIQHENSYTFYNYMYDTINKELKKPIVKVFTGR